MPQVGSFAITIDGSPHLTSFWVAQERDWYITARATYPAEPRHDPEFLAAMSFLYAQNAVRLGKP
jgi:hypothetical protein